MNGNVGDPVTHSDSEHMLHSRDRIGLSEGPVADSYSNLQI